MLSYNQIKEILEDIEIGFQDKKFKIFHGEHEGKVWVQVGSLRPDCDNPNSFGLGKGGKAYISEHASDDEIVKKIMGLCLAYVEHETRESFYYKGKRVFGPHISLAALMEAADSVSGRLPMKASV